MAESRMKVLMGFLAAVGVLAVSSAAFACTVWIGEFSVSHQWNASTTDGDFDDPYERVRTFGLGVGMNHCAMKGAVKMHFGNSSHAASTVTLKYGEFTAGTPSSCANVINDTPEAGTYTISYLNTGFGEFKGGNTDWLIDQGEVKREYTYDCMAVGGHVSRWIDSEELVYSGSGTVTKVVGVDKKPSNINSGNEIRDLPGTESAICIQKKAGTYTGAPHGGQAPVIVI